MPLSLTRVAVSAFDEHVVDPDPLVQFRQWFDDAERSGARQADTMIVATATPKGEPGRVPWESKPPADPELVAKVSDAIGARAGADNRLGRHLRGVADELLAAGFDHATVARRILEGDPVDA